jgi:group I intron endonuclease
MVIYQITNNITSDFYVGKTINPKIRFSQHKYNATKRKSRTYLHRAMRKYGVENFTFTILDNVNNPEELNPREIYWIEQLSPKYNMTKGGDGCDTSNSPNYKLAIKKRDQTGSKNGMYGRKRIIPKQQLDNAHKAAQKANCCPVSCDGKIFNSVGEAQSAFPGISIRKRLNNEKYPTFFRLRPKTKRIKKIKVEL